MQSSKDEIRKMVRKSYARVAQSPDRSGSEDCCSGSSSPAQILDLGQKLDYTNDQLAMYVTAKKPASMGDVYDRKKCM